MRLTDRADKKDGLLRFKQRKQRAGHPAHRIEISPSSHLTAAQLAERGGSTWRMSCLTSSLVIASRREEHQLRNVASANDVTPSACDWRATRRDDL